MSFTVRRLKEERPRRHFPWKRLAHVVLWAGKPVTRWWMAHREKRKEKEEHHRRRMIILRRVFLSLAGVLCVLLLIAGTVQALVNTKVLNLRTVVSSAGAELPRDKFGHLNILLLGQGDDSHQGVDLTDTLMLASLDPEGSRGAVLLSIPRDLYFMKTEKMGVGRVNSLYRDYKYRLIGQGMEKAQASDVAVKELAAELGRTLGVDIHRIIKVDFIGFVQAVDAVGGVDIDVPYDLVDPAYPGPNYSYQTFSISKGPQLLDGETALKYARSRHTTSDFSRSARQQQIIQSLGKKVKEGGTLSSPNRILSLLQIMQNHVETTMSLRELIGLGDVGSELDHDNLIAMQLNTSNSLYGEGAEPGGFLYTPPRDQFGGASVLLPISIPPYPVTWKQLQVLAHLLINVRSPYLSRPTIHILNAGAPSGTARKLANEFIRFGFQVEKTENAENRDEETSYVQADEQDAEMTTFLHDTYGFTVLPAVADPSSPSSMAVKGPVKVVLGKDFVYKDLQSLLTVPENTSGSGALDVSAFSEDTTGSSGLLQSDAQP